jgi:hypothetical protein
MFTIAVETLLATLPLSVLSLGVSKDDADGAALLAELLPFENMEPPRTELPSSAPPTATVATTAIAAIARRQGLGGGDVRGEGAGGSVGGTGGAPASGSAPASGGFVG